MAALAKLDKKHVNIEKERVRSQKRATGDYMKSVNQAAATAKATEKVKTQKNKIQVITSQPL